MAMLEIRRHESNESVFETCINLVGLAITTTVHMPECSQDKNSPKVQLTEIVPVESWIISKMNVEINQELGTSQHSASTNVQSHLGQIQDSASQQVHAVHRQMTEDSTHIPAKGLQQRDYIKQHSHSNDCLKYAVSFMIEIAITWHVMLSVVLSSMVHLSVLLGRGVRGLASELERKMRAKERATGWACTVQCDWEPGICSKWEGLATIT